MFDQAIASFIAALGGVIFVDLILSGDNALVIGAAAAGIPRRQRLAVLALGGIGAIMLRVLFTTFATFLLNIPFLQTVGGLLVLVIALKMVQDEDSLNTHDETHSDDEEDKNGSLPRATAFISRAITRRTGDKNPQLGRFLIAIATITIADITMSLDNIVAIGALARGHVVVLAVGLIVSILILLVGSALVSELVRKIPSLILIASLILAWVCGDLILHDLQQWSVLKGNMLITPVVYVITFSIIIVAIVWKKYHQENSIVHRTFKRYGINRGS